VLWCTGGGFHDYKGLTPYLTQAIQKRARVGFDVSWDYKTWGARGFADKYDAVVFYFSYHDPAAQPIVDNIAATIHAGKPAVFIHGALHSFRGLNDGRNAYCEAIGLTSVAHDALRPMATRKVADHPITRFWPDDWKTPGDELYQNVKVWPGATPLLKAFSPNSLKEHTVAWVNQYGKGRVFGTSLGHDKRTAGMDVYPQLLANGLLWACDKLDAGGQPKAGYGGAAVPR
jgi:type 1 glutamine amidotransferase